MRSTAGSSNSPSRDDWLSTRRAILPSAQSENPLNISTANAKVLQHRALRKAAQLADDLQREVGR